ncbi:histidine kinase [Isoptericola sp. NEAU-Y5]|uniref:histidine kinase n=1 Tax=Isoptericola luteus TaxID=2879484 RepID=A0ABS7ZCM6_9MICO|nr:histidine kinase [Isoptericola sp. NEAU-Y5]MCA5892787.1 histidine kinase [Isoptericola sp. NEAU-Y5]
MGWYERTGRWFEAHRFGVDLTVTLLVALPLIAPAGDPYATAPYSNEDVYWWTVAVLAPLPWRRTRPVASAAVVFLVTLAHMFAGLPVVLPGDLVVLVALYSVTVYGPSWAHVGAMSLTAVGTLVALPLAVGGRDGGLDVVVRTIPIGVFCLVTGLAVWAIALARRSRRVTLEALRDRAHRLEVERDQQIQIGAAAERARIAREMHDIVAHSLSIVVAQADGGRYAAASDPAAAVHALATISETGRTALTDMRRLLGVLREQPDGDEAGSTPPGGARDLATLRPAPQPDADQIEDLVAQARAGGLRVALVRVGDPRPLPAGMGLTVFRVCQESLTNVRKHAGPDPAVTVTLRWSDEIVRLEVLDDGRGAAASARTDPGFGLRGMRERANLYGGTLETGPRRGGGFRVCLELPLPGAPLGAPAGHTAEQASEQAPELTSRENADHTLGTTPDPTTEAPA